VPLSVGELGPHLTMSPGPRHTLIPSGILIYPTVWPQYTNVTDRQDSLDNGPVAQGKQLLVTVAQNVEEKTNGNQTAEVYLENSH